MVQFILLFAILLFKVHFISLWLCINNLDSKLSTRVRKSFQFLSARFPLGIHPLKPPHFNFNCIPFSFFCYYLNLAALIKYTFVLRLVVVFVLLSTYLSLSLFIIDFNILYSSASLFHLYFCEMLLLLHQLTSIWDPNYTHQL